MCILRDITKRYLGITLLLINTFSNIETIYFRILVVYTILGIMNICIPVNCGHRINRDTVVFTITVYVIVNQYRGVQM